MSNCAICTEAVTTNQYVRAKQMVAAEADETRVVYKPSPSDEHRFYCLDHGREGIEEAIAADFPVGMVRVMFNPGPKDWRMAARRQRVRERLERAFGEPPSNRIFAAALDDEDARLGVSVTRHAGIADGLRKVTVRDRAGLHAGLRALLGEPQEVRL
jgi:hypothetical protein